MFRATHHGWHLGGVLALILVLQPLEAEPSVQRDHARVTNNSATTHANASVGVPKHSPEHLDPSTIRESWSFFLNSLALTITAGSTLFVALVIVKMQSLSISLTVIERSLAEAFSKIGQLDKYSEKTSKHFLDERWKDYFVAVGSLAIEHEDLFSRPDRLTRFTETQTFVLSLVEQGRRLQELTEKLVPSGIIMGRD